MEHHHLYSNLSVGDRVGLDGGSKLGTLRFLGPTRFRPGVWAGIELDEPEGRHNGTVEGVQYFECRPNHGLFLHPSKLTPLGVATTTGTQHTNSATAIASPTLNKKKDLEGTANMSPRRFSLSSLLPMRVSGPKSQSNAKAPPSSAQELSVTEVRGSTGTPASMLALNASNPSLTLDKLPELEAELERRKQEVERCRQSLAANRLAFLEPMDVAVYQQNRENLLTSVDSYDRAMAKYDRQLRRVAVAKSRATAPSGTEGTRRSLEEEHEDQAEIKKLRERTMAAEEAVRSLEVRLESGEEHCRDLQERLEAQTRITAEITLDRNRLRKELAEARDRLGEAIVDNATRQKLQQEKDDLLEERQRLLAEREKLLEAGKAPQQIVEELQKSKEEIELLRNEKARLLHDHEHVLQKTAAEMEILNRESNVAIGKYEEMLANARKEIEELQGKVTGRVGENTLDVTKRLQGEIAARDQRINELLRQMALTGERRSGSSALHFSQSSPPAVPSPDSTVTTELVEQLNTMNVELQGIRAERTSLELRLKEVVDAKNSQEQFFTAQINRLKRRLKSQLSQQVPGTDTGEKKTSPPITTESAANDETTMALSDLHKKIEEVIKERDQLKHEKETEIYALQLRLNRLTEDRQTLQNRVDELVASQKSSELATLRIQIQHVTDERQFLREELKREQEQVEIMDATIKQQQDRLDAIVEQLDERTDQLTKHEQLVREQSKTLLELNDQLKRRQDERTAEVTKLQTMLDQARRQREVLEAQLQEKEKLAASYKEIVKEKSNLVAALNTMRQQYDDLEKKHRELRQDANLIEKEQLTREILRLSAQVEERNARINLLDMRLRSLVTTASEDNGANTGPNAALLDASRILLHESQEEILHLRGENRILQEQVENLIENQKDSLDVILRDQLQRLKTEVVSQKKLVEDLTEDNLMKTAEIKQLQEQLRNLPTISGEDVVSAQNVVSLKEDLRNFQDEKNRVEEHYKGLLEVAESELHQLQRDLESLRIQDQQRRTLLAKQAELNEKIEHLEAELRKKDEQLQNLNAKGNNSESLPQKLKEDGIDAVLVKVEQLQRTISILEHEKKLLEDELETLKGSMKRIKEEAGLAQQHELLSKAGQLIQELGQAEDSSWRVTRAMKRAAAFMHLYQPTEVHVEVLQREYESIMNEMRLNEEGLNKSLALQKNPNDPLKDETMGLKDKKTDTQKENPFLLDTTATPLTTSRKSQLKCTKCLEIGHDASNCGNESFRILGDGIANDMGKNSLVSSA